MLNDNSSENLFTILEKAVPELWPATTAQQLSIVQSSLQKQEAALLREVRANSAKKGALSTQLEEMRRVVTLVKFALTYCKNKNNERHCFYSITLEWLLDSLQKADDQVPLFKEISQIFAAFLNHHARNAIRYYTSQKRFEQYPAVKENIDVQRVNFHLHRATKQLSLQSPSGIILLMGASVGKPHQFAALLIWAINQGITPKELIQSSLLHHFLIYHLCDIGQENNPISQVYHWLSTLKDNEKVKELVKEAQRISSEQRAFEDYSLTGRIRKENDPYLLKIKPKIPELILNLTEENMLNLHRYFGADFLAQTIELISRKPTPKLQLALQRIFENSEKALGQLSKLITLFFRERDVAKRERLFKTLAMVISDEHAKKILANNTAVLCLVPFKPSLVNDMAEIDLNNFVNRIIDSTEFAFDALAQLIVLIKFLTMNHNLLVKPLFEKTMDFILSRGENAELATNDDGFLTTLLAVGEKYFELDFFRKKLTVYENILKDFVIARTREPLTKDRYSEIEDCWLEQLKMVNLLSKFYKNDCLLDKYSLKVNVISYCLMQQKEHFNLTESIDAVTGQHEDIEQVNNEKRRIYFELLSAVEDGDFLAEIIDALKTFNMDIELIVDKAITFEKWSIIGLLCRLSDEAKINKENLLMLIKSKKHSNKISPLIFSFCERIANNTLSATIGNLLATQKSDYETRNILYELIQSCKLNDETIIIALSKAAEHNNWRIVDMLSGLLPPQKNKIWLSLIKTGEQLASVLTQLPYDSWTIITPLGENHIKSIIQNCDQLGLVMGKITRYEDLPEFINFVGIEYVRSLIQNGSELGVVLSQLGGGWYIFIEALGKHYIDGIIQKAGGFDLVLQKLKPSTHHRLIIELRDSLYKIKAPLDTPLMQSVVKFGRASTIKTFCEKMPAKLLVKFDINASCIIIKKRLLELAYGVNRLNLEEFDTMFSEQIAIRASFDYFIEKYTALREQKITPEYFNARIDDFCNIITLLTQFFIEKKDVPAENAKKELKNHLESYAQGDGKTAANRINRTNSFYTRVFAMNDDNVYLKYHLKYRTGDYLDTITSMFFFPTNDDPYHKYRTVLLRHNNISALKYRLDELQATVYSPLARSNEIPPAVKAIVQRITEAFERGGFKPENILEESQENEQRIEF